MPLLSLLGLRLEPTRLIVHGCVHEVPHVGHQWRNPAPWAAVDDEDSWSGLYQPVARLGKQVALPRSRQNCFWMWHVVVLYYLLLNFWRQVLASQVDESYHLVLHLVDVVPPAPLIVGTWVCVLVQCIETFLHFLHLEVDDMAAIFQKYLAP